MQSVAVLIPNLNGKHLLEQCYRSIFDQKGINALPVLIDNGSTDDSVEWTEKHFPAVKTIRGTADWGFARAMNEGIRATDSEWILGFNNDAWLAADWAANFLDVVAKYPSQRVFSCCGISGRDESLYYSLGDIFDGAQFWRVAYQKPRASADLASMPDWVVQPSGYAALFHRSVAEKLGGFIEEYHSFCEDVDYFLRAFARFGPCRFAKELVVYHLGGATGHFNSKGEQALQLQSAFLSGRNGVWLARTQLAPFDHTRVISSSLLPEFWRQLKYSLKGGKVSRERVRGMLTGLTVPPPQPPDGLRNVARSHGEDLQRIWKPWEKLMVDVWGFKKAGNY